jgi:hypothetical protein
MLYIYIVQYVEAQLILNTSVNPNHEKYKHYHKTVTTLVTMV